MEGPAETAYREYKLLAEQLVAIDPNNRKWRLERIYADTNLGNILIKNTHYREASATFQRSLPDIEALVAAAPANRDFQDQLSETLAWLSQSRESEGALDEALGHRERQLALLEQQSRRSGTDAPMKRKMLAAQRALGRLFAERGDVQPGLQHLVTSVRIADDLASTEPANTEWAEIRAASYLDLGELQLASSRADEAGASARAGCDIANRLAHRDPTVVAWRVTLRTNCLSLRARLALAGGADDEAQILSSQAVALAQSAATPTGPAEGRFRLAEAQLLRAEVADAMGDRAAAEQALRNADSIWPKTIELLPPYLLSRAMILRGLGRRSESRRLCCGFARWASAIPTSRGKCG